ncbi:hypothetical protein HPB50_015725 [Hyalomma asiaticum]|uniref:Uncharacterized protein n=1 Tax=Hyalomma asiaticum TaxID=266040 RepID=A0ACB7SWJ3_HYAAI|nr:hypothetical protein HPB50_015725 [Hyalomma asiaticum]
MRPDVASAAQKESRAVAMRGRTRRVGREEARNPLAPAGRTGSLGARPYQPARLVELYLSCGQRGRLGAAGRGPFAASASISALLLLLTDTHGVRARAYCWPFHLC